MKIIQAQVENFPVPKSQYIAILLETYSKSQNIVATVQYSMILMLHQQSASVKTKLLFDIFDTNKEKVKICKKKVVLIVILKTNVN